jgi:hypothetical protein
MIPPPISPAEHFQEAQERHEAAGEHGPRWIPLAAAVLAVLAAISGFVGNLRATASLSAKDDAIIATTRAADAYNEYESRSIKQHISEALLESGLAVNAAKLRASADHEASGKDPLQRKAAGFERDAALDAARSEHMLVAHETLDVATTLFEVAIVLVSITALAGSKWLLPITAATAAGIGVIVLIIGVLR